jgi:hypothetical protein
MKRETKHAKRNETKWNEIYQNETKRNETKRNATERNKMKRNLSKQNETTSCICICLYLYIYSAGTDHGYRCTGRRAVGLVQLLEGTIKALYCLCAHYTVLKVVPIDYSFWKEWIFPDVCLKLDEFEGSRVVHCLSIYYISCFKSFVLFGFSLSFVPYFFQIVFW